MVKVYKQVKVFPIKEIIYNLYKIIKIQRSKSDMEKILSGIM